MKIKWAEAQNLLQEGDILLFRAKESFFSLSYWIAKYSMGEYSHVSLASINPTSISCCEFREFVGSREHPLVEELNHGYNISVFRISRVISTTEYDETTGQFRQVVKEFTPEIAKRITDTAKEHIGRKEGYSWPIIWKIAGIFIPIYRLFINKNPIIEEDTKNFVCSTFVSYAYRKHFIDIVEGISDVYTTPSDISRSGHLNYLFTIQAEK